MSLLDKIVTWDEASSRCSQWKAAGLSIVFTNGCFDLLHKGHVLYLEQARALGEKLVVAVNSDDSTHRLKGEGRPIVHEEGRFAVVAALGMVDMVVPFSQDTPQELITQLKPDIYAKGGDYTIDELSEAPIVRGYGGEVRLIPFVEGYSSTAIADKARSIKRI